jgi:multidrug resistance efflux pump
MHVLSEALWVACNNYQAMQQAHLHCLETAASPDIERLVFEREQRFADLQNCLTALAYQWQTDGPEAALVDTLLARLTALREGDVILDERLQACRVTLTQARAQLQQGQKVLIGYGNQAAKWSLRVVDRSG